MQIRAYQPGDLEACVTILRSNVPLHCPASDEAGFRAFLAALPGPYFVVAAGDGAVVACGGIALEDDPAVATLCWGIVRADAQLRGVGSALLWHRLEAFLPLHQRWLACGIAWPFGLGSCECS